MFLFFTFRHASMERPLRVGLTPDEWRDQSAHDLTEVLRPINVFSGPNGSGKSFFLRNIVAMAEALEAYDVAGDRLAFGQRLVPEPGDFWACTYLLPGTAIVLDYRLERPRNEREREMPFRETLRWRAVSLGDLETLDPAYEIECPELRLRLTKGEGELMGLSLLDPPLKEAPNLRALAALYVEARSAEEEASAQNQLAQYALLNLRESLTRMRFEYHSNYLAQWDALPTTFLRSMAESVDGAYPRVDAAWLESRRSVSPECLEARILEQKHEVPTAYEKLCVAASRLHEDGRFRAQIDQFSSAEKRLLLLSAIAIEVSETEEAPWLVLVENPDERLYRENSEAFVLLLRELGYYRPGTQWILSSSRSTFLDNFYPEEIWQFKTNFGDSDELLMVYEDPVNLGRDPVVQAMVDEGVPLSELAYEGYF